MADRDERWFMIPIKSWQRLPSRTIWFWWLTGLGVALVLIVTVLVVTPASIWKTTADTRPLAAGPPAPVAASDAGIAPGIPTMSQARPGAVAPAQSGAAAQSVPADYAVACALHGSGDLDDVIPCAKFGEAERCRREADFPSKPTAQPAVLSVVNRSGEEIKFYWLNTSGGRTLYASLPPGGRVSQQSHIGAHWLLSTRDERCIAIFNAATMTIGIF